MTLLYLAGPMTGLPDFNFPAFRAEAARLRAIGYEVVNPVEVNGDVSMAWADCLKRDIVELLKCEGVATLPNWKESRGSALEVHIAAALGMWVVPARDLVTRISA